jgi:serine/threonine protein kinase
VTQAAEDAPLRHPRLEIRRVLGAGGMGVVHAAYDPVLEREVAVKVIRVTGAASGARARILREARAIARISHPNVVHVYSADAFDDQVAIVMELVQGQTLRQWLADRPRTWQEILAVFVEAGRGLAAAHDAGLVHRDFKPDNVMVRTDGRACVLDFGLARALEAQTADGATVPLTPETARAISAEATVTLEASGAVDHASPADALSRATKTGALVGTPLYMAPEQHLGAPTDARADQFAFCVALYRALFGQHPFDDTTYATLVKSVVGGAYRVPPSKGVPRRLLAAVHRGLSHRPECRFERIADLLTSLTLPTSPRQRLAWRTASAIAAAAASAALIHLSTSPPRASEPTVASPKASKVTTFGDVEWARPSPDEKWLLLGRTDGYFIRDLEGRGGDRMISKAATQYNCEPSWSWRSDFVLTMSSNEVTNIVSTDPEVAPREVPLRGCVLVAGPSELVAYFLRRGELRFWDINTGRTRTCVVPGNEPWVTGLDISYRDRAILITLFDEHAGRHGLWSMNTDCSGAAFIGYLPHAQGDRLGVLGDTVRARWGRVSTEVIAATAEYSPPSVSIDALSTVDAERRHLLSLPSLWHFSVSRSGVLFHTQNSNPAHVWLIKKTGEISRLTRNEARRHIGGLTPDGDGVLLLEETSAGRSLYRLSLSNKEMVKLSEHNGTEFVPFEASISEGGVLALMGVMNRVPSAVLVARDGRQTPLVGGPALGFEDMAWVGESLVVNLPVYANYAVFENGSRRDRDLLAHTEPTRVYKPEASPDGDTVAFSAVIVGTRRGELRIASLRSQQEVRLEEDLYPVGWSADGRYIFAMKTSAYGERRQVILRVPKSGGPSERWLELPDAGYLHRVRVTRTGDAVAVFSHDTSDVYSATLP